MQSAWNNEVTSPHLNKINLPEFPRLEKDIHTDVLIIGGGIAGILCAYFLQQAGVKYALVEGKTICQGVTRNTTAKITAQHGLIYDKLFKDIGVEGARRYYEINQKAVEKYRTLCMGVARQGSSEGVDCDFEEKDAYVYTIDKPEKIKREVEALRRIGVSATFETKTELPFPIAGAVKLKRQAQFHPLKFISAIAKDLNIYEHTHVGEMIDKKAVTEHGTITARKIIVATHFPFINKHGSYFLKQYQHRSYVIALENGPNISGMYVDEAMKGMSFRNAGDLLLIGGGDHRTGKRGGNWQELEDYARKYYPDYEIRYHWAAQDCMSLDSIPYIGNYSKRTPDLFVCTGFNKWGITSAMVSAMILTDLVMGRDNPYAKVFSPSRSILKPQLAFNAGEAILNLLTPTAKRCPHLGCALKWNSAERSWDCPCHGSRFTEGGILLDNPANESIDIKR